eukprot:TRINITY_DN329_c0_g2_i6.p3 TRINITY_DN329_c0_g2~~TRINITY_DN329_c0_g2_i6.p3  ORF type:complete len:144 (-),score=20.53 TRINITY_DN329_c0_g2_i6:169-600(-)
MSGTTWTCTSLRWGPPHGQDGCPSVPGTVLLEQVTVDGGHHLRRLGFDQRWTGVLHSPGGALVQQPFAIGGSGSTYIYGYCDANYKEGMTKEECQAFVKNALALAMSRDGSSGGVIRLVTVDKDGSDRKFFGGEQLPSFWEKS